MDVKSLAQVQKHEISGSLQDNVLGSYMINTIWWCDDDGTFCGKNVRILKSENQD